VLWIDAICINQEDVDEKSHQVAMMGDLYSRCLTVYIWLGVVNHSASRRQDPFAFIRHFADDKHYHELPGFYRDETGRLVFEENAEFIALWDDLLLLANSTW